MRLPNLRLPKVSIPKLSAPKVKGRVPRVQQTLVAVLAFVVAGGFAVAVSWTAAQVIERRSAKAVNWVLAQDGITWAKAQSDGLLVTLVGTAPNEAARFRAMNLAGSVIDSGRGRDARDVTPVAQLAAPRFSIEMLRNDDGIQLIGLLPEGDAELALTTAAAELSVGIPVADMLETAAYPAPAEWQAAFDYGITALKLLPRSKISVATDSVEITAIATSEAEKRRLESELARLRPEGLAVSIDVSAPRPVLTPFTLRFVIDADGAQFDACSADTDRARDRILSAATAAGMTGKTTCIIGLGVPSPRWSDAVVAGIKAVAAMGKGTITFSDADVTLLAAEGTSQAAFDRAVGELQAALPDAFSLDATLPKTDAALAGPVEFTATLAEDGKVELRGRLTDDMQRDAVDSFAKAQFGVGNVYTATRLDGDLPDGWPVRVLAGLEALGQLETGALLVREDTVEVSGVTGSQNARGRISQILSDKLGQGQTFKVAVSYDSELDPLAALPTPEECLSTITALLSQQKITFPPGSAEIDAATGQLMTRLADAMNECTALPLEIAGHTDSQGSEEGNRALSQARADAVLLALQGRRVEVSEMRAVGYGEARPIADNETEEGREANRRIEFTLIGAPVAPVASAAAEGGTVAAALAEAGGVTIPVATPPGTSEACVANIKTLLAKDKITFDPGSDDIAEASSALIEAVATLLKQCPGVPIEVGGHTDSQGSSGGNQRLSEGRAKAVLVALKERGVDVATMKAVGYGEAKPIADNDTGEGREANRRIEFTLIAPAGTAAAAPAAAADGEDLSTDSSPSIAPQEKTLRPVARPANNG